MASYPTVVKKDDLAADSDRQIASWGVPGQVPMAAPAPMAAPMPQTLTADTSLTGDPRTWGTPGQTPVKAASQSSGGGDLRGNIVGYARTKYGDEGAGAVDAVLTTEGGLNGAVGDNGQSYGPLQFYRGGGQLNNLARQQGMSDDQAAAWVQANPEAAARWGIDNYLGQAIEAGLAKGLSGPELATYVQRTGQVSVNPERAGRNWHGGQNYDDPNANSVQPELTGDPSTWGTPGQSQYPVSRQSRARNLDITPDQFGTDTGLSQAEAMSACGPAAAVAFARATGRNPTLKEATALAAEVGWNPDAGMAGAASEKALLDKMGVASELDPSADWGRIERTAASGSPVTISTGAHYFVATGYDPNTGKYFVGTSGRALRGGSDWMTREEIEARGAANGALYLANQEQDPDANGRYAESRQGFVAPAEATDESPSFGGLSNYPAGTLTREQLQAKRDAQIAPSPYVQDPTASDTSFLRDSPGIPGDVMPSSQAPEDSRPVFGGLSNYPTGTLTREQLQAGQEYQPDLLDAVGGVVTDFARDRWKTADTFNSAIAEQVQAKREGRDPMPLTDEQRIAVEDFQMNVGMMGEPIKSPGKLGEVAGAVAGKTAKGAVSDSGLILPGVQKAANAAEDVVIYGPDGQRLLRSGREVVEGGAPPLPPEPPRGSGFSGGAASGEPERAGNILLPKYVQPEVREMIEKTWQVDPARAEAARRGVIPDAEVRQMAEEMAVDNVNGFVKKWTKGDTGNAETLLALRTTLADKAKALAEARDAVRTSDSAENVLKFRLAFKEQQAVQEVVHGVTAEAGRALRQFRQTIEGAIQSGDQAQMSRVLERLGGREPTEELVKAFSLLDESDPIAVNRFLRDVNKPKWRDKAIALSIENMFTGRTLMVNAFGNAVETVNRPLMALSGGEKAAASADVRAMALAMREGWSRAALAFTEGIKTSDVERLGASGKYDVRVKDAFPGKKGMAITPKLRITGATDEFFYTINYAGGLAKEAVAESKRLGRSVDELMAHPTERMRATAQAAAEAATFQGKPSSMAKTIIDLRNNLYSDEPGKIAVGAFTHSVLPFVKIADNIFIRGANMTASPIYDPIAAVVKGAMGKDASANVARLRLSVPLIAIWGTLALDGNLTGNGPKDAAKRQMLTDATDKDGNPIWQAHSVKIGNRWFDYTNLGPAAVPMSVVGTAVEAYRTEGFRPNGDQALAVANETALALADATFIQSMGDLFRAINQGDATGYGEKLASNVATRFIPHSGLINQVSRGFDADTRSPQGIIERIEARLPGLKENVPTKLNPLGQEARQTQDLLASMSPVRTSAQREPNPVAAEVARLQGSGQKLGLGYTPKDLSGIPLTREEQFEYQQYTGTKIREELAAIIAHPSYQALADDRKAVVLDKAENKVRANARETYSRSWLAQQSEDKFKQRAMSAGLIAR